LKGDEEQVQALGVLLGDRHHRADTSTEEAERAEDDGEHAHDRMNQELAALAQKAEQVNVVDGILTSLGMVIVDLEAPEESDDD